MTDESKARRCLCCYQSLHDGETDYHPRCAKRFFGQPVAPQLPYTRKDIGRLAQVVVESRTTVTGVQAKLSMDLEHDAYGRAQRLTIVGVMGRYILKPQTERFECLPEIEDLTMHLAQQAGIAVVPHCLARFTDGRLVYLTKRIDRTKKNEKIPMEDLCQLSEQLTDSKYRGSYDKISKVIKQYSAAPMLDVVNFWQVVLFCWIVGNSDMHLKNFSLFAPDGQHILSPAYDMINTLIVMPEDTDELALSLNGRQRKITWLDFVQSMTRSGVPEKVQENMRTQFTKVLPQWEETIRNSFLSEEMQNRYLAMIHERLTRLNK